MLRESVQALLGAVCEACPAVYGGRLVSVAVFDSVARGTMRHDSEIDSPKWHDVGPVLLEQARLFPETVRSALPDLARISKWLRKEREFWFFGDIDFIPMEQYFDEDAVRATADAVYALQAATGLVHGEAPDHGNAGQPNGCRRRPWPRRPAIQGAEDRRMVGCIPRRPGGCGALGPAAAAPEQDIAPAIPALSPSLAVAPRVGVFQRPFWKMLRLAEAALPPAGSGPCLSALRQGLASRCVA